MGIKLSNNAFATLAASINSSATSITLTTGQGARFPSLGAGDYFYATLVDTSNNLEIVKCTARSTDVLTVVRAQESTTARAYSTGDRIEIRLTAQTFLDATAIENDEIVAAMIAAGAVTDVKIAAMAASKLTGRVPAANAPSGSVLQVVQALKTNTQVFSAGTAPNTTFYEISDLTLSITPSTTGSKILLIAQVSVGQYVDAYQATLSLVRNGSTRLGNGTSGAASYGAAVAWRAFSNNATSGLPLTFLDSPSTTSATTYGVWMNNNGGSTYPSYVNRSASAGDWFGNLASTLIAMEIAP